MNWLTPALCASIILSLAGCGGVGPAVGGASQETFSAHSEADIDQQIAKHTIESTPFGLRVKKLPEPRREKVATVLSYRAMDNDLAQDLPKHMNDLERAGSSPYANLVAFADGDGDGDSLAYYLREDASAKVRSPYQAASIPLRLGTGAELNSSDPKVLEAFVGWGFREYRGRFKLLDVSSHGSGYQGMCADFRANYDMMPLDQFATAIRRGLKGRKLDVLNLLACLMSTVEVAYEFRDAAEVMVASEDIIFGGRVLVYSTSFGAIASRRERSDARTVARQLIADAKPENPRSGTYTLAAIDLEKISEVKRYLNTLSNRLIEQLGPQRKAILAAYDAVPVMAKDKGQSSHRDLIRFCTELERVPDSGIKQAARDLKKACQAAILVAKSKKMEHGRAAGLSVYLPDPYEEFNQAYLNTRLAKESSWDEFLTAARRAREAR